MSNTHLDYHEKQAHLEALSNTLEAIYEMALASENYETLKPYQRVDIYTDLKAIKAIITQERKT